MSPLVVASIFPWIAVAHGWSYTPSIDHFAPTVSQRVFAAYPEITQTMLPHRLGSRIILPRNPNYQLVSYSYGDYAAIEAYARTGGAKAVDFFREEYRQPKKLAFDQALYGWAVIQGPKLTDELIGLTGNWNLRPTATLALGVGGDPHAIPKLLQLVAESPPEAEWSDRPYAGGQAVQALARMGTGALPALHRALQSPNSKVRSGAVAALSRIGDRRSVGPLRNTLPKETDWSNRRSLVITLGQLGDARILPELLRVAQESAPSGEIAQALGKLREDPRALAVLRRWARDGEIPGDLYARYGYGDLREHWESGLAGQKGEYFASGLGRLADPRSIPVLAGALHLGNYGAICQALVAIGKPAIPSVARMLDSPDSVIRAKAAVTLGMIGDPSALPYLNKLAERQPTDARSAMLNIVLANVAQTVRVP